MADQGVYEDGGLTDENPSLDYTFVPSVARVAVYDDMKMAPHIIEVEPAPTAEYIEKLTDTINTEKNRLGGKIPYSAIREVSENFIHARFEEVVVSVLDGGNTIRFCDQGPGIKDKDKATLPGFTSATEPMKHYIRGVGSGLPLVKEYLDLSHGKITIEDNLNSGSVVTISLEEHPSSEPQTEEEAAIPDAAEAAAQAASSAPQSPRGAVHQTTGGQPRGAAGGYPTSDPNVSLSEQAYAAPQAQPVPQPAPLAGGQIPAPSPYAQPAAPAPAAYGQPAYGGYAQQPPYGQQSPYGRQAAAAPYPARRHNVPMPPLSEREVTALTVFAHEGALGVTELSHIAEMPMSSTYALMDKLEQNGLIERTAAKKRILTDYGDAVYRQISSIS